MDFYIKTTKTGKRRMLILAAALLLIILSAAVVYAATPASIKSPSDQASSELGKEVTINVSSRYDRPDGTILPSHHPNYIYFRVSKDGNTVLFTKKSFSQGGQIIPITQTFTPTEETGGEGAYLIEVCKDYTYVNGEYVELSEEDFADRVEDSCTIRVWKDISKADTVIEGITDKVYTGSEQTQALTVTVDGKTLTEGGDYSVTYAQNVNAGTATLTVNGIGEGFYRKSVSREFQITPADITKASVSGLGAVDYSGSAQKPAPVLTWNGMTLTAGTDYDVAYSNNTNVGTAGVTITGKGNFSGEIAKNFAIRQASIRNATMTGLTDKTYNGSAQTQNIIVRMLGRTLVKDTDYTVTYKDNTNPGTATMTITGKGNFKDSLVRTFQIKEVQSSSGGYATIMAPDNGASFSVGDEVNVELNGQYTTPSYNGTTLTGQPNYLWLRIIRDGTTIQYGRVPYNSTSEIKVYRLEASTKGVYTIQLCRDIVWELNPPGSTNLSPRIIEEENYVPTAQVKIYVGMSEKNLSGATVTGVSNKEYTGNSITLSPTVKLGSTTLRNGTDYYCLFSNNLEVGEATLTIKGKGSYFGTIEKKFNITPKAITAGMITLSPASFTYNGSLQKPEVSVNNGDVRLVEDTDYTLVNEGGTEPGQYDVTVTGKGNYTGTGTKTYSIGKIPINSAVVTPATPAYQYSGSEHRPAFGVKLNGQTLPSDVYTVAYSDNINAGTGKITVTAKEDSFYTGSAIGTFTIDKVLITSAMIKVNAIDDVVYNRQAQKPVPEFTFGDDPLTAGTDFTLAYSNNINKGRAEIAITGKGNYAGTRSIYFMITAKDIADESVAVDPIPYQCHTEGTPATPTVTVRDGNAVLTDAEYEVAYTDNDKVGKASVTITGKGNYTGSRTAEFDILDRSVFAVNALQDKIAEVEESLNSYLAADKKALQEAIDADKALIASEDKTTEQLEEALGELIALQTKAEQNLAKAKADAAAAATAMPSVAQTEKMILALKGEKDPAGARFAPLMLRSTKQGKSSVTLAWSKVSGASSYIVYGVKCGKNNKVRKLATVSKNNYTHKKLKKGTYYKYIVIAVKNTVAGQRTAAISRGIHVATKGGKVKNPTKVTVKSSVVKKAKKLKKGKSLKLNARQAGSKVKKHRAVTYESTNTKIATVSKKGVVKAKSKGSCYIYAYAQNGKYKKIKVTVK